MAETFTIGNIVRVRYPDAEDGWLEGRVVGVLPGDKIRVLYPNGVTCQYNRDRLWRAHPTPPYHGKSVDFEGDGRTQWWCPSTKTWVGSSLPCVDGETHGPWRRSV